MDSWREVWRVGVALQLSELGLLALQRALQKDDPRLLQGATVSPPPSLPDCTPDGACPVAFGCWHGDDLGTIGDISDAFAQVCYHSDKLTGEPADIRHLLNWVDETPREKMRRELLAEVNLELSKREVTIV